ncbi:hypothetical protein OROMI_011740 [Orobanche minor]
METDGLGPDLHGNHGGMFDYGLYHHSSLHIVRIRDDFRVYQSSQRNQGLVDGFAAVVWILVGNDVESSGGLSYWYFSWIDPTGPLGIYRPMLIYHELVTTLGFVRRDVWWCVGRCCVPWLTSSLEDLMDRS